MSRILWLASYPKSGNTWLRVFLHNLLLASDEPHDINRLGDLTVVENAAHWYRDLDPRPASSYSPADVQRMRPIVQRRLAGLAKGSTLVKTHNALVSDGHGALIDRGLTAGAVYVVRNPLDVVISYAHHRGQTIDEMITVLNTPTAAFLSDDSGVYELLCSWSAHVESWTNGPLETMHIMRYEDMVAAPRQTFERLAQFLDIDQPGGGLERAIRFSSFAELQAQEQRRGFVERPRQASHFFRDGRPGQWRNILTPRQVAMIVDAHREQMRRFDYVPRAERPRQSPHRRPARRPIRERLKTAIVAVTFRLQQSSAITRRLAFWIIALADWLLDLGPPMG